MRNSILKSLPLLFLGVFLTSSPAGEVAIYTGNTSWIDKASADAEAQVTITELEAMGIVYEWFASAADEANVALWVKDHTDNGELDVLILYGWTPTTIYAAGNTQPDGSIAELFIESTDGDAILNHADYLFYVSSPVNGDAGLRNIMDNPTITMWDDNTPVVVTEQGAAISLNLVDYQTDRPFHLNELGGEWYVEASLAQNAAGTRADPVVVRDGNRGRLIIAYQTAAQVDPKGAVAAEILDWLFNRGPSELAISAPAMAETGMDAKRPRPMKLTVSVLDYAGTLVPAATALTVNLASNPATGAFDTDFRGKFDGSVTSVTIPAGQVRATAYYSAASSGTVTLSAAAPGLGGGEADVNVFANNEGTQGDVAIYTGRVGWITKALADAQAQICIDKLGLLEPPIVPEWFSDPADGADLATWVEDRTDNGEVDVLVLYGHFPTELYPGGNAMPDGSIAELFIESTDGDVIINHADYMFYVSSTNNGEGGLRNMMDIATITMWDDNTPMTVTPEGKKVAPSLNNYLTDRPFHVNELAGEWFVEVALAQNATGIRADPIIVRDGDRGRLAPALQAADQNDPKGAVAAEMIAWIYGYAPPTCSKVGIVGRDVGGAGQPIKLAAQVQDKGGSPCAPGPATTVNLATNSGTGRFDIAPNGNFDGTITSVTIAAGASSAAFYYKDATAGAPILTGSAAGLADGTLALTLYPVGDRKPEGEVAIYTGATWWITKPLADQQAQICVDKLDSVGIQNTWYDLVADQPDLADWMTAATGNGKLDVLVLYGSFPPSIYPNPNVEPDGSIAEKFIESTDGDVILNHGDWMFYYVDGVSNNGAAGLQNMMDIPGYAIGADNTSMVVTKEGMEISQNLVNFLSDRPFFLDLLAGDWYVEVPLALSADGTKGDPVIVRDGELGRLIPVHQAANQNDPKGAVAAEIIAWLMQKKIPKGLGLRMAYGAGTPTTVAGTPAKLTVSLLDQRVPPTVATTVTLASDSAAGKFDTIWDGPYNGTVTSVTIPAGALSAMVYYKDTSAGSPTLTAKAPDRSDGKLKLNVLEDICPEPGEVAIFTGNVGWITKAGADAQAQICVAALDDLGIQNTWFANAGDQAALATWVEDHTDNGMLDVLVLYGYFPPSIYGAGNSQPDGSIAELFIESTDGDMILNHADYMFYVSSTNNGEGGIRNMMDNPTITMWDDNTSVVVTYEGSVVAPSLTAFLSDRPFHMNELAAEWFVEASLAQNAAGTRADPCIVRDGNRGRLAIAYQTASQENDPKGAVAAEIIDWVMQKACPIEPEYLFIRGDTDGNGQYIINDGVQILERLFAGRQAFGSNCDETGDVDGNGQFIINDAIWLFNFLFADGPDPVPPVWTCGTAEIKIGCDARIVPFCRK